MTRLVIRAIFDPTLWASAPRTAERPVDIEAVSVSVPLYDFPRHEIVKGKPLTPREHRERLQTWLKGLNR